MAGAQTTVLRLCAFVFIGLNIVAANKSYLSEAATMHPATGYHRFNTSCILLGISCSVDVDLHVWNTVQSVGYDLPQNAIPSGNCSSKMSYITLDWSNRQAKLSVSMTLENEVNKWKTSSIQFTAKGVNNQSLISNGTEKSLVALLNDSSELMMKAGRHRSFKCDHELTLALNGTVKVNVIIKEIQLELFGEGQRDPVFSEADVCTSNMSGKPAEPVDTIVPTAVGCVLAGLIVILIITYFVGRCKRPGYQKM